MIETIARYARAVPVAGVQNWMETIKRETNDRPPRKADQDRLDAVLCALIGCHWRIRPRQDSIMIGDLISGYMIAPADAATRSRLAAAAAKRGVPIDGAV